ncbi:MAG: Holliday junction resolvase RuvX [Firmicutes bacterium]|nr:Holliday junction resolvase RuvX [Bacillota bacterium]
MRGRTLGIDVGRRRIGVALTDELGVTAQGLSVLARQGTDADVQAVADLARRHGCSSIVVGLPRRTDGRLGPEAQQVQAFGARLAEVTGMPVIYWDERFSTAAAEKALIEAGMRRARRRGVVDQVAASLILQSYLDRQRGPEAH